MTEKRPETIGEADLRSRLRDTERRICDLTAIIIGAKGNDKGGRVWDLKSLVAERQELQMQMALVNAE